MHSLFSRSLTITGFVVFGLTSIACGGSKRPAQAPTNEASEAPRVGSMTPDPKDATPAPATSSSADNGSDIIPPFPSSGPSKASSDKPADRAEKADRADKADKADKVAATDKDGASGASADKEHAPPAKKKAAKSNGGAKKTGGKSKKKG